MIYLHRGALTPVWRDGRSGVENKGHHSFMGKMLPSESLHPGQHEGVFKVILTSSESNTSPH